MRDFIHICGLAALTAFLVTRLPSRLPAGPVREAETAPFVSYVTLSAAEHAARLEMARTFWQMGDAGRGHVSIGGLDSGVHLLEDAMPAPTFAALPPVDAADANLPAPELETYALMPPSQGRDQPEFSVKTLRAETDYPPEETTGAPAFDRKAMLLPENSTKLKELLK